MPKGKKIYASSKSFRKSHECIICDFKTLSKTCLKLHYKSKHNLRMLNEPNEEVTRNICRRCNYEMGKCHCPG